MTVRHDASGKVTRHRQRLRAAGLRPVQVWVPDTRDPAFAEQIRRQCAALRSDPAEADALEFTEAAARDVEGWQ
jgi:hypothetical protein